MSFADELRKVWLAIDGVALPIADVRDGYVRFPGIHRRFSQLDSVYRDLRTMETALFEFLEVENSAVGSNRGREILMVAQAALNNARVLAEVAQAELQLLGN